jgi:hypothetical protein
MRESVPLNDTTVMPRICSAATAATTTGQMSRYARQQQLPQPQCRLT